MPKPIENFDESLYTHNFITDLYDEGFMERSYEDKRVQNINFARILIDFFKFDNRSVVDFGCGTGVHLNMFKERGCEVRGFEYSYDAAKPQHEKMGLTEEEITFGDVSEPIKLSKKYDVAMSIEVAEHIPKSKSDNLVSNLVNATDGIIFFTAAGPNQSGTGHINCQPKDFWRSKFAKHGWYVPLAENKWSYIAPIVDKFTPVNYPCTCNPRAVWHWLISNLMIFQKEEKIQECFAYIRELEHGSEWNYEDPLKGLKIYD